MEDKKLTGEEITQKFNEEHKDEIKGFEEEAKRIENLMKPMSIKAVQEEIDKINSFLSEYSWMDFEFGHIGMDKIVLYGSISLHYYPENDIEITFEYPQTISGVFYWTMDEKKPFIQLSTIKELNKKTGLYAYDGCHIFKFNDQDEDDDSRFFIAAAGIKCKMKNK